MADRLARLGSRAGPSAALDERVLASARAAVGAPASAGAGRRRPQPRWPVAFGVAATLALAIGIAWQLRPGPGEQPAYSEAPRAFSTSDTGEAAAAAEGDALPKAVVAAPLPPREPVPAASAEAAPATDAAAKRSAAIAEEARREDQARARQERQEDRARFAEEAIQDAAAEAERATTDAPQAFPSPAALGNTAQERRQQQRQAARPAAGIVIDAQGERASAEPAPPPPPPAPQAPAAGGKEPLSEPRTLDRIETTGSRIKRDNDGFSDAELDDQPPATADSPKVREAWLQRIRELVAAGEIDEARTNLDEFKRRYPRYALPGDLHALHRDAGRTDARGEGESSQPQPAEPPPADD